MIPAEKWNTGTNLLKRVLKSCLITFSSCSCHKQEDCHAAGYHSNKFELPTCFHKQKIDLKKKIAHGTFFIANYSI
jgi:hypothetical protein